MTIRSSDFLSQEHSVEDLLGDTPRPMLPEKPEEPETSDERVLRKTQEGFIKSIAASIQSQYAEQIKVAREISNALYEIRSDENGRMAARALRDIHEEVQKMRASSHIHESVLFALNEVRDVNREQRAELQGISRGIDETNRLLGILTALLSNGHATH